MRKVTSLRASSAFHRSSFGILDAISQTFHGRHGLVESPALWRGSKPPLQALLSSCLQLFDLHGLCATVFAQFAGVIPRNIIPSSS
ncbi:MAG: hypothetical protein R3B05_11315 [Nitrospira sp.]